MTLYGIAGGLMWFRALQFVLVQEMLGQVRATPRTHMPCALQAYIVLQRSNDVAQFLLLSPIF